MSRNYRNILLTALAAAVLVVPVLATSTTTPASPLTNLDTLNSSSESATVLNQATLTWDLDAIMDSYESTRTIQLPVPSGLLNAAVNEVQVWSPHNAVIQEEVGGTWVTVDTISARMLSGVLLDDPLSAVNLAIDADNDAVAGSIKTQHFLYSFNSDGATSGGTTIIVTVYLDGVLPDELVVDAPPSPPRPEDLKTTIKTAIDTGIGIAGGLIHTGLYDVAPQDEDDLHPEDHANDLKHRIPSVSGVPLDIPVQHPPSTGCMDPANADSPFCLQVIPYMDSYAEAHYDGVCRIMYALAVMHGMWDSEVNIHLEPLPIRETNTAWSTGPTSHINSFYSYLDASSTRMPGGTDMAVLFTGRVMSGVLGIANTSPGGLGSAESLAVVQVVSESGYDAGVHVDQAAAHEMIHVAGHGKYAASGIDGGGHYGQSSATCADRSWYGKCKKWEYNIMHDTWTPKMALWMYATSEGVVESYSHPDL